MQQAPEGYSTAARLMHWIVAVLVLLMIPAGFVMTREGISRPLQDTLFLFHKNSGVILFAIVVVRLIYRQVNPPPALPDHVPGWQRLAADISHRLLYVALFVMPISGYVRVRAGGFPIEGLDALGVGTFVPRSDSLAAFAQSVHFFTAFFIVGLVTVHVGAALQHAVLRRDGVFFRMWPPYSR